MGAVRGGPKIWRKTRRVIIVVAQMNTKGIAGCRLPIRGWRVVTDLTHLTDLTYLTRRLQLRHALFLCASLWTALLAVCLTGCGGYHLGPTNGLRSGERSLQVNPFVNQTIEPRLSDAITLSLRKNLQRDGTYRLDTRNEGDIILSGTIVNYDRSQLSFQPTDVLTPRQYRV